ncbi:metallophosphoesterase family protein [Bacillus halotolerans]|uniref:metallophosphoesterase family protein n=1 Tax=Bacillus halotolerans TaxID=260554 RepID=UPI003305CBCF
MKIDYVSDLHINHWIPWNVNQIKWEKRTREIVNRLISNGNGEVLIIAGDFTEWNQQTLWVLDEAAKQYEKVYFTYGNHDLYLLSKSQKRKYSDSIGRLNDLIKKAAGIHNVTPLIKTTDTYRGKVFAGDVMWYLPKGIEGWDFFKGVSNDSNYIWINGYNKVDGVRAMWKESMDWYETLKNTQVDVFVSHIPPVHNPYSPFEPNTCYMVEVPFINAKHWICGHDHLQAEFDREGTGFHMNCIGYPYDYDNYPCVNVIPGNEVDSYKTFELKTFEI